MRTFTRTRKGRSAPFALLASTTPLLTACGPGAGDGGGGGTAQAAIRSSLQQGRGDVVMSTISGLRHAAAHQTQTAVNGLIADGTYARIRKTWGPTGSALDTSRISPPERKN